MEAEWNNVRKECAGFDILSVITQALEVVKEDGYWEDVDSATEIQSLIRRHFSHTTGDSGIANALHGFESPEVVIFEGVKAVLDSTFDMLVQRITSFPYDIRDITEDAFYNWRDFFHNGAEFEAIHIAILMFGDEDLRTDWSRVLSNAFKISRSNQS